MNRKRQEEFIYTLEIDFFVFLSTGNLFAEFFFFCCYAGDR